MKPIQTKVVTGDNKFRDDQDQVKSREGQDLVKSGVDKDGVKSGDCYDQVTNLQKLTNILI